MAKTEFEIYQEAVISIMTDFLNDTQEGEDVVGEYTDKFAKRFALNQQQRCAVKVILSNLFMVQYSYGDIREGIVGININCITRIAMNDWNALDGMLDDN